MNIEVQPTTLGELETLAAKVGKSPAELAATLVADAVESYRDQPEELAASFAVA
jgi:hypothetical protein